MAFEKVAVFDTTLRDGEQAAGTRLGSKEDLTIARQLTQLQVDIVEAGCPASSPDDFEAVRQISIEIQGRSSAVYRAPCPRTSRLASSP